MDAVLAFFTRQTAPVTLQEAKEKVRAYRELSGHFSEPIAKFVVGKDAWKASGGAAKVSGHCLQARSMRNFLCLF